MDRNGEAMARDAFRQALRVAGVVDMGWRRGAEPPDYYLRVGRTSYAVEVTRVMERHAVGSLSLPTHGVRASLEELPRAVERAALRAGILSGSYGMTLAPVPNLRAIAPQLIAGALRYLGATRFASEAPRELLLGLREGRKIAIQKVACAPDRVGGVMFIGPVKRAHRVHQDLVRLLGESMAKKAARLARVRLPRVLLLVDSYVYGELDHWRCAISALDVTRFHTVARIADVGVCHVLHSEKRAWSGDAG